MTRKSSLSLSAPVPDDECGDTIIRAAIRHEARSSGLGKGSSQIYLYPNPVGNRLFCKSQWNRYTGYLFVLIQSQGQSLLRDLGDTYLGRFLAYGGERNGRDRESPY